MSAITRRKVAIRSGRARGSRFKVVTSTALAVSSSSRWAISGTE